MEIGHNLHWAFPFSLPIAAHVLSKDESFQYSEELQNLTDKFTEKIDNLFAEKEKDILKV